MRDEVDSNTARSLVVQVAEEAERSKVPFEFFAEKGSGLPTARVAGALGAKEDECTVWGRAGC